MTGHGGGGDRIDVSGSGHGGGDRIDVSGGLDTDHDGAADTLVVPGQPDLMLAVDTSRDGLADVIIEIGPDAVAHRFPLVVGLTDPLADACYAEPSEW
ncbi:MAG: hypothetical protein ACR2G2_11585 [Pseudonocardia sp.]